MTIRTILFATSCVATLATAPIHAASRNYGMGSFDTIRLEGPYRVEILTGKPSSARADGDVRALDGIAFVANGTNLTIKHSRSSWGGWIGQQAGQVTIYLTTPSLKQLSVVGPGTLSVNKVSGGMITVQLSGNGAIRIAHIDADRMNAAMNGTGSMDLGGTVGQGQLTLQGAGTIDAPRLVTEHLTLLVNGNGTARTSANRTASVTMLGTGSAEVAGKAVCTVKNQGSGSVACGSDVVFADTQVVAPDTPASSAASATKMPRKTVTDSNSGVKIHRGPGR